MNPSTRLLTVNVKISLKWRWAHYGKTHSQNCIDSAERILTAKSSTGGSQVETVNGKPSARRSLGKTYRRMQNYAKASARSPWGSFCHAASDSSRTCWRMSNGSAVMHMFARGGVLSQWQGAVGSPEVAQLKLQRQVPAPGSCPPSAQTRGGGGTGARTAGQNWTFILTKLMLGSRFHT